MGESPGLEAEGSADIDGLAVAAVVARGRVESVAGDAVASARGHVDVAANPVSAADVDQMTFVFPFADVSALLASTHAVFAASKFAESDTSPYANVLSENTTRSTTYSLSFDPAVYVGSVVCHWAGGRSVVGFAGCDPAVRK